MSHDPLCPYRPEKWTGWMSVEPAVPCRCGFIAKVRADERKRHLIGIPEQGSGTPSSGLTTSGAQITWQ